MTKKFFKILSIALISIFLLFSFPKSIRAVIGTGIFDFFETSLEGVEEKSAPIARIIVFIFITAFIGIIALLVSSTLLQWVLDNPQWLTLKNPVVESGLYFTTGLVNLFIILFFVAIAIAWILNIQTFAAKKALPKLILVALLVNFVPIFIGIPIDIATFIYKAILTDTNLIFNSFNAIFGGIWNFIIGIGAWIVSLAVMFMIPFSGPLAQYGLILLIAGMIPVFAPTLLSWIIQTILAIVLSGIFFTLAFLFACRIFVIWFLTIVAPLAFLCLVLPQTEKYWKEWLQHLTSWVFFGLIVLLFLVIGLKGAQYIHPGGMPPVVPGFGWLSLPVYFGYYFFLFVYLSIVTFLSVTTAPQLAKFLLAQAGMFVGMVGGAGVVLGRGLARRTREASVRQHETQREAERKRELKTPLSKAEQRSLSRLSRWPTSGVRWIHRQATGMYPEEAEAKIMKKIETEATKIETPATFRSKIIDAKRVGDVAVMRAYASAGIEKGREFKKVVREVIPVEEGKRLAREANIVGRSKEAERLARAYIDKATKDKDLEEMGFRSYNQLKQEEKDEWDAKGYKTIAEKLIGEAKGDEIKDFAKNFWKNKYYMGAINNFWRGPQMRRAAQEFGRTFTLDYMVKVKIDLEKIRKKGSPFDETDFKKYVFDNTGRARFHETTAAQELGFQSYFAFAPDRIRKKYPGGMKQLLAEKK